MASETVAVPASLDLNTGRVYYGKIDGLPQRIVEVAISEAPNLTLNTPSRVMATAWSNACGKEREVPDEYRPEDGWGWRVAALNQCRSRIRNVDDRIAEVAVA